MLRVYRITHKLLKKVEIETPVITCKTNELAMSVCATTWKY
ncbi:hypothetical protein SAMN04487909_15122 [Aneurinibacillus migulanus]|uniref:Uncharacterized protein n=1 Tax=Aneurinibacillus migulanus TaxID=47500 RepID=A0A1G9BCL0_ANEMI|nr:hypothetical protein SAMN04487909_15122 [Aneurinibacillus migulanus]